MDASRGRPTDAREYVQELDRYLFPPRLKTFELTGAYLDSDEYPATRTLVFDSR
jgi:hypothetical protein